MARVVVVTDSTAALPPEVAAAAGIEVVPLPVIVGAETFKDGDPGTTPAEIVAALTSKTPVSTSRPAPAELAALYQRLAAEGVDAVLAVHLTAEMSGTVESARMASRAGDLEVLTVDTRGVGPGLGFAALAGARALARGATLGEAAEAVMARADAARSYFYVDTLEYLRRGGRIGAASALVGSALAVKPLLAIEDGRVVMREKVRTSSKALARLEALAVEAAESSVGLAGQQLEAMVVHLGAPERATTLVEALSGHWGERLVTPIRVGELGAVLGAHVGPGMVAVCVAPALDPD